MQKGLKFLMVGTGLLLGLMMLFNFMLLSKLHQLELRLTSLESSRPALPSSPATNPGLEKNYLDNQVKNSIKKQREQLSACYQEFLKTSPVQTDGVVQMDWQIDPQGKTLRPEVVESPPGAESLGICLAGVVRGMEFPPPPGEKNLYVLHRFSFATQEQWEEKKNQPLVELVPTKK